MGYDYNQLNVFASVNRWVSTRFNLLSSVVVGITAIIALVNPRIDASLAGFTLAFASTVTNDVSSVVFHAYHKILIPVDSSFSW